MRRSRDAALLALSLLAGGTVGAGSAGAETILIQNQFSKWKLGSTVANPLLVEVKKADIIEFRVTGPHGVVTLDKAGDQSPAAAVQFVQACGEDAAAKPEAVLREIECGAASQFNKPLSAPMKLEVLDKFEKDVNFWCIVHVAGMWGTFKLANPKP